jgi:hypothetical protein
MDLFLSSILVVALLFIVFRVYRISLFLGRDLKRRERVSGSKILSSGIQIALYFFLLSIPLLLQIPILNPSSRKGFSPYPFESWAVVIMHSRFYFIRVFVGRLNMVNTLRSSEPP